MIMDHAALAKEAAICRQIWVGVLLQAARDLLMLKVRHTDAVSGVGVLDQYNTRQWIGSRDFREVCQLAGYDPARVERALHRRMSEKAAGATLFPRQGAAAHKPHVMQVPA